MNFVYGIETFARAAQGEVIAPKIGLARPLTSHDQVCTNLITQKQPAYDMRTSTMSILVEEQGATKKNQS